MDSLDCGGLLGGVQLQSMCLAGMVVQLQSMCLAGMVVGLNRIAQSQLLLHVLTWQVCHWTFPWRRDDFLWVQSTSIWTPQGGCHCVGLHTSRRKGGGVGVGVKLKRGFTPTRSVQWALLLDEVLKVCISRLTVLI